jgi:hypothetical protein
MDRDEILSRLEKSAAGVEELIQGVMLRAMADGIDPYQMLRTDETPILAPLVVVQASCFMLITSMGGGNGE